MEQNATLQISLSAEELEFVKQKVAQGEYGSPEDVIVDSVHALMDREDERRRWELEVLLPIHDELMSNPSSAIPIEEVERRLEARRQQRRKSA